MGILTNSYLVGGGEGGVGFSTPTISTANYKQWCEARLLTGMADGDAVATFTDRSGAGNDWTQSTGGNKPTYKANIVNARPVLRFNGASSFMTLGSDILSGKSAGEVFLVFALTADPTTASKDGLWNMDGDNGNADNFPYNGNGNFYLSWGSTARKSTGYNPTPSLTSWHILNIYSAASDWGMFFDGASAYTTATNTFSSFNDSRAITLGKSDGGFGATYYYGDIAAIVILDAKLNTTDRNTIKNNLAATYAITVT